MPYSSIVLSVLLVSSASLIGVFLLSLRRAFLQKILLYLVSFATGALFANVFLHILPEMTEVIPDMHRGYLFVLAGIVLSFVVEKFIHWHHCHNLECEHAAPIGTMMLIGDGVHNVTDGVLIATAYLADPQLGIATTIAVIVHEIPQEIGDFSVLLHSGFSTRKALAWNFISALAAFLGAGAVLFLSGTVQGIEQILLPIAAGNLLYIAGSDLIPELHKESRFRQAVLQLLAMLAGIALMYGLVMGDDGHAQMMDGDHATQEVLGAQEHQDEE